MFTPHHTRSFCNRPAIRCCTLLISVDLPADSGVRRVNVPAIPHWDRLIVCIELLVRIHGGTSKCSDYMFQQLPKTCVSLCMLFIVSYYWDISHLICHDILQIGYYLLRKSRHSQSYDVSMGWTLLFFLWEANRGDSNNCTLRVSQFQPVGNWFLVALWIKSQQTLGHLHHGTFVFVDGKCYVLLSFVPQKITL